MMHYDTTTALIVVDVQNDFAHPEGTLYIEGAERIIPQINQEVQTAQQGGATLVYTRDWHPPETPHFDTHGGPWPVHCVQNTWGAMYHSDLLVVGDAIHVKKGQGRQEGLSAFHEARPEPGVTVPTGLGTQLWQRKIIRAVIVGLAEDGCVKETAIDARRRDLITTVLDKATVPVDPRSAPQVREELTVEGVRFQ